GIRDFHVTGVQTCALPIFAARGARFPRFALGALLAVVVGVAGLAPSPARAAEQGWIKSDLKLNLRTGGGNEYRIIGTVSSGDPAIGRAACRGRGQVV